jgi:hypothetical protein
VTFRNVGIPPGTAMAEGQTRVRWNGLAQECLKEKSGVCLSLRLPYRPSQIPA